MKRKLVLGYSLVLLMIVGLVVGTPIINAVIRLYANNVSIPITVVGNGLSIYSISFNNVQCTISTDGQTAVCPAVTMTVGQTYPLSFQVQNNLNVQQTVSVTFAGDNGIVTEVPFGSQSSQFAVPASSISPSIPYTITAVKSGNATLQMTLSGFTAS